MIDICHDWRVGVMVTLVLVIASVAIITNLTYQQNAAIVSACGQQYFDCQAAIPCCGNMDYRGDSEKCDALAFDSCPLTTSSNVFRECVCGLM